MSTPRKSFIEIDEHVDPNLMKKVQEILHKFEELNDKCEAVSNRIKKRKSQQEN